jgi:meso-butanediol dehydrogenase/(S,S)-butanediol dehydrogenase/diacetyl reductase
MMLEGKVALITGGGTGLGVAIAQRFVRDGARICISGRRREKLENTAGTLPKGSVLVCPGDVTKEADVKRMVEATLKFGGKLDVLVNNAGADAKAAITELSLANWQKVIDINLTGPFLMMREVLPIMIKAGRGSIINIASLGGTRCLPGMPAYCTSKAALIMLTQQAALDYGPQGIRVNAVCPGGIDSDMLDEMILPLAKKLGTNKQGALDYFSKYVPMRRVSKPQDITGICSYLASDDSTFMTGSALLIDGGCAIVDASGAVVGEAMSK